MTPPKAIINRVKDFRTRRGLRQSDLADAVGVTRQTILAIEKGRLNPSILVCLRIADALNQPLDAIFTLAPDGAAGRIELNQDGDMVTQN